MIILNWENSERFYRSKEGVPRKDGPITLFLYLGIFKESLWVRMNLRGIFCLRVELKGLPVSHSVCRAVVVSPGPTIEWQSGGTGTNSIRINSFYLDRMFIFMSHLAG